MHFFRKKIMTFRFKLKGLKIMIIILSLSLVHIFTTCPPALPDVLGSGRNVGALRQARRVGFRSLAPGIADDIF